MQIYQSFDKSEGVASLIIVKDGVKNMIDSCATFKPSDEMLLNFNKEIYHNVEAVYGCEDVGNDAWFASAEHLVAPAHVI